MTYYNHYRFHISNHHMGLDKNTCTLLSNLDTLLGLHMASLNNIQFLKVDKNIRISIYHRTYNTGPSLGLQKSAGLIGFVFQYFLILLFANVSLCFPIIYFEVEHTFLWQTSWYHFIATSHHPRDQILTQFNRNWTRIPQCKYIIEIPLHIRKYIRFSAYYCDSCCSRFLQNDVIVWIAIPYNVKM